MSKNDGFGVRERAFPWQTMGKESLALLAYFALLNVCCLEVFMRIFVSVSAYVYSSEGRNLR